MHQTSSTLTQGAALTAEIAAWEDDPMSIPEAYTIRVPAPELDASRLAIKISENAPVPAIYAPGTSEFRYWTAAASLWRAVDYWRSLLPDVTVWEVGPTLPVRLDAGEDLNAYYSREEDEKGLSFFHKVIGEQTIYTGESSDVVCHEIGHAILDTIRPDLYDAASGEIASFHESFADISALLAGLQIKSLREAVLVETNGDLRRPSRLSRLGEQLGWAIRQVNPDRAGPDCLRNAVNSFIYRDPTLLPPSGPNTMLTSEPHSFSRVFTGGFFDALASMVALQSLAPTERDLLQASQDAGKLLVAALQTAPAAANFYSQVAAQMLEADQLLFDRQYNTVLANAFVQRGILSQEERARVSSRLGSHAITGRAMVAPEHKSFPELSHVSLSTAKYGLLSPKLLVSAAGEAQRPSAAVATSKFGVMPSSSSAEKAAQSFVDNLFQRGKVDVGEFADVTAGIAHPAATHKTHKLIQTSEGIMLMRTLFQ